MKNGVAEIKFNDDTPNGIFKISQLKEAFEDVAPLEENEDEKKDGAETTEELDCVD